jgi:hypothetical protein
MQLLTTALTDDVPLTNEFEVSMPRNKMAPPLANAGFKSVPYKKGCVLAKLPVKDELVMTEAKLRTNKAPPPTYPSHFLDKREEWKDSESKRQVEFKKLEPTMLRERTPGLYCALLVIIGNAWTNL